MTLLHINELYRKDYGLLSKQGLRATFSIPELYHATTIADFLKNKDEIEVTSKWKVSKWGRSFRGLAFVLFPSCTYSGIDSERRKAIEEESKRNNAREVTTPEEAAESVAKSLELIFQYMEDGKIFDATGELYVQCNDDEYFISPTNNQRLYSPAIVYDQRFNLSTLVSYDNCGDEMPDPQKDPSLFLDFFSGLNLQPV